MKRRAATAITGAAVICIHVVTRTEPGTVRIKHWQRLAAQPAQQGDPSVTTGACEQTFSNPSHYRTPGSQFRGRA